VYQTLLSIAGGGNTTIDLRSFTDVVNQTAVVLARVKFADFQLLSAAQVAPDGTTTGTAAVSVTIGNSGANAQLLDLGAAAHTRQVKNGGFSTFGDGSAAGYTVDATHKDVKIVNDDGAVTAKVLVTFVGGTT